MNKEKIGFDFYEKFFVGDKKWNSRYPNFDEATRLGKILPLVAKIAQNHYAGNGERLRLIDVGCGRGWLTHQLNQYGVAVGIEPVPAVADYATKLYPEIEFHAATP